MKHEMLYLSIQISLLTFLINKKNMFIEKRYLVKLNSIKYCLLLIKQKQNKKIKNKKYRNVSE